MDKYRSHLWFLTYLCRQILLGHLFGLPALGNQLSHVHVNLLVTELLSLLVQLCRV